MTSAWFLALLLCASSVKAAVDVPINHIYKGRFQATACIKVTRDLSSWIAHLVFDRDIDSIKVFHAISTKVNDRDYALTNLPHNGDKKIGESLCIDFVGYTESYFVPKTSFYIEGMDDQTFQFDILDEWEGGFKGNACTKAYENLNGWEGLLRFHYPGVDELSVWNATATRLSKGRYRLTSQSHNAVLNKGDKICFLFVAACHCSKALDVEVSVFRPKTPPNSPSLAPSAPDTKTSQGNPVRKLEKRAAQRRSNTEIVTAVPVSKEWDGGFKGSPCVKIVTELRDWTAHLTFGGDIDDVEAWVATPVRMGPNYYQLKDKYNSQVHTGEQLCFEFIAKCSCSAAPAVSIYIEGNFAGTPSKDYAQALKLSLIFYAAQRSGKLPANNPVPWRGDSGLGDCVPGGWYDAGDHVKFGLPMAASTTLLTWGLIQFKDGYQQAGQLDNMYDSIRWPLDYFIKSWDDTNEMLLVQVGDAKLDHKEWSKPEDMKMARPCMYIDARVPGSDIAGMVTAAMAAGSMAFASQNPDYSTTLLQKSESLYQFAVDKQEQGPFQGADPYYRSLRANDELCLAAMFLYKATKNSTYLSDAKTFVNMTTSWSLFWEDESLACQILLFEATGEEQYKTLITNFFWAWSRNGNVTYTPCGLAWRGLWGADRHAGNAAFAALVAADLGIRPGTYRKWAVEQVNYMLGDNHVNGQCFSFLVGYGANYPQRPHHRGASCPDQPAPCGNKYLYTDNPNPHILYGALVGGPEANDHFGDERKNYYTNEVATDYNSGFQGALAGITELTQSEIFPNTDEPCPCSQ